MTPAIALVKSTNCAGGERATIGSRRNNPPKTELYRPQLWARSSVGNMVLAALRNRLHATQSFEETVATILEDVIAFHGAECGNVQLPRGDELLIVAQRGLGASFLKRFKCVKKEYGCACGRALRLRRTVVIRDVAQDPEFAAYRDDAKAAGFRAVQTTPLFTGDGMLLGMVSNHFANVHEPTPFEIEILRSYSVVAAEHAYRLLGKTTLAEKAEQMNALLYDSVLAATSAESRPVTPPRSSARGAGRS